jgi:hypothetical protein
MYLKHGTYFKKYVAETQLPGNVIRLLSIRKSSTKSSDMACHWRIPTHQMNYKSNAAAVYSSSQLSISAQAVGNAIPIKLPSQCKTCSSTPFLKLSWQDGNQGSALAFRPLSSVLRSLYTRTTEAEFLDKIQTKSSEFSSLLFKVSSTALP